MEHLIGYERAILIDAIALAPIRSIFVLRLGQLPEYSASPIASALDMSPQIALELSKLMGAQLPEDISMEITKNILINSVRSFTICRAGGPCVTQIALDSVRATVITNGEESQSQG